MTIILIFEILILVIPFSVNGIASHCPSSLFLRHFLLWRYSTLHFWRICFVCFISLLAVFIFFAERRSSSNTFFLIWLVASCICLGLIIIYLFLNQTFCTLHRPLYLRSQIYVSFSLINLAFFIFGCNQPKYSLNWAAQAILICQGIESFSFLTTCLCLALTWHMGRPYHKPFHSSKEIETSDSHPYTIDFISPQLLSLNIPKEHSINLGMSFLPGRYRGNYQRSLPHDVERIKSVYHIDMVVSLLPEYQLAEMRVSNLEEVFQENQLQYLIFGWRDKWIPSESSLCNILDVVETIVQNLREGRRILVHCFGGKGRTGVVIVSVLIRLGIPLPTAIDMIRTSRRGCIHNPLQLFYLNWINNYLTHGK